MLQHPAPLPQIPVPPNTNPGVVGRSAVNVSSNLLPPAPTAYDSNSIAAQQRAALSAAFAQRLMEINTQAAQQQIPVGGQATQVTGELQQPQTMPGAVQSPVQQLQAAFMQQNQNVQPAMQQPAPQIQAGLLQQPTGNLQQPQQIQGDIASQAGQMQAAMAQVQPQIPQVQPQIQQGQVQVSGRAYMTLPELQNYVRSQGRRVMYEKRGGNPKP